MADLLIEAAKAGNLNAVRDRLDLGDDIDEKNDTGCNALIWAANNGHVQVVQLLIERGANLDVTTSDGRTVAKLAKGNATEGIIASALQQPRRPAKPEDWVAMGAGTVAFVGYYPGIERKLTQIFNFETRQQLILSENLRTRAETAATPVSFGDLPREAVEKAVGEFERLGGKADRDFILDGHGGIGKPAKKLPGPGAEHG